MATTFVDYTGDGNATKAFSFPSIQESDIKVTVDEVLKSSGTHYNITSYTTTGGGNVVFTSGNIPASPAAIRIFRDTNVDAAKATYTAGSSVKAEDLNNNQKQLLFAVQEEQNIVSSTQTVKGFISAADKVKLDGIETAATADQTAAEIRTLVESATDSNVFTDADHTKLNAIESGATGDQTNAEIRAAVEAATDSNVFTDADHTKLNGIETSATADQTDAEIKTAYENNSNTNAFTDAEKTKLSGIATGADVTSSNSINALTDVNTSGVADGKILKYQASSSSFIIADDGGSGSGGATAFTGLSDTPANYGSAAGKTLKVNSSGNAIEFVTVTTPTQDIVDDTTPQLGGNLDVQTNEITTSTTNGNVKLNPNGTGVIEIKGSGTGGTLQLNCENNSHGVKIKSPPHSAAANYTLTLPTGITNAGVLKTDANGNLSWDATHVSSTGASFSGLIYAHGGIQLGSNDTIKFDSDDTDTNHISFKGPTSLSSTVTYTLPEDGTNGQFLKTNGSGVLSFADVTSTYNIQINTLSSSSGSGGGSATFNGSATRFTLSNPGTNAQAHLVSVNGVVQKPNSGTSPSEGFAIDGNDIIFASAPATGSDFFILTLGNAISLSVPADDSVTSAKIANGAVSGVKIAQGGVTNSQILDDTISEAKLDIHAAPSGTDKVLGYTANGMEWVTAAAGATGGGTDKIFYENGQTVTTNYTITNNTNAMSAGPVTINSGVDVTIGTGENWTIV